MAAAHICSGTQTLSLLSAHPPIVSGRPDAASCYYLCHVRVTSKSADGPCVVLQMCMHHAPPQYGWVMDSPRPQPLFGVDRHDFDYIEVWKHNTWEHQVPDPFTAGGGWGAVAECAPCRSCPWSQGSAHPSGTQDRVAFLGIPAG
jgi:hypothetical protein